MSTRSFYYTPGTIPGLGDIAVNKTDKFLIFRVPIFQQEGIDNNNTNKTISNSEKCYDENKTS